MGIVGFAVVALGLVLIPFPGPGWLVVFVGLGILASEFAWAQRLLDFAKGKVQAWTEWVKRQSRWVQLLLGAATLALLAGLAAAYVAWKGVPFR